MILGKLLLKIIEFVDKWGGEKRRKLRIWKRVEV